MTTNTGQTTGQASTVTTWRQYAPILVLFLAVMAVFFRVLGHEFLDFDDNLNVYENPLLINLSPASLLRFWMKPYEGLYIPLTYSLWAALAKLSTLLPAVDGAQFNPRLFHGANLILHGANTIVLFFLLRLLVKKDWPAAAGALLFALHPVQVEEVAWVTGLKGVLSGFFSLLALWQYARHGSLTDQAPAGRWPWHYLWATLFFLAAMLAKPSAVVLPLLAGLVGVLLLGMPVRRVVRELVPWLVLIIPVVVLTKLSQPDSQHGFLPSIGQRFLIAGDALSFYFGKLVLPVKLSADYGRTPELVLGHPLVYATGLLPYLLASLFLWKCRNAWALAAVGIIIVVLAPVLGFVPFTFQDTSTVADRYLYLALVGPALLAAWLLARCPSLGLRIVFAGVIAALAIKSAVQVQSWRDSWTFNNYTLASNPNSWLGYHNLGLWYFEKDQLQEAIDNYEKALALKPTSYKAYNNLGMIFNRLGRKQEAIDSYKKALAIKPDYALGHNNVAVIYKELGQYDQAITYYRQALVLQPEFFEVYVNLAQLYRLLGQSEEAISTYQKAAALRPNNAELVNDIGLTCQGLGRFEEAIAYYRQALAVKPRFAEAHANLGVAYKELGNMPEAIAAFRKAVDCNPELVEAYVNLGYLLAGQGEQQEAIQMYNRALILKPDNEIPHYALGIVYFDLGRDEEAIAALQQALTIKPDFGPAYNGLSRCYLRTKQFDLALESADKAASLGFADQQQLDALAPYRKN